MQGIVTDQNGAYVKAAILKLIKLKVIKSELDTDDGIVEAEMESVTYVEADEEGRFVIQDLNSEEKYIIEIFVEMTEAKVKTEVEIEEMSVPDIEYSGVGVENEDRAETEDRAEAEDKGEAKDFPEINFVIDVIDSVTTGPLAEPIDSENLYMKDQYNLSNTKDKLYMRKTNLW